MKRVGGTELVVGLLSIAPCKERVTGHISVSRRPLLHPGVPSLYQGGQAIEALLKQCPGIPNATEIEVNMSESALKPALFPPCSD